MISKRELMLRIIDLESMTAGLEEEIMALEGRLKKVEKPKKVTKKTTKKTTKK